MADTKLLDLTEDTGPTADDMVYVAGDPAGTPVDRKVKVGNLLTGMVGNLGIWAPSTNYKRGDLIVYGGHRFQRLGADFTSGTLFDPSNWIPLDPLTFDNPALWGAATANDLEFDVDGGSSLPTGLTGRNTTGLVSTTEKYGWLTRKWPASATLTWRLETQLLSGYPSTWLATAKVSIGSLPGTEVANGLCLYESAGDDAVTFYWYSNGGSAQVYVVTWTATSPGSGSAVIAGPFTVPEQIYYFRVRKNSGTSYDFEYCSDPYGADWIAALSAYDPSALGGTFTPDEFGFASYVNANKAWSTSKHFLRVR